MNQGLKKVIQVDSEKSIGHDTEYFDDLNELQKQIQRTKEMIQQKRKLRKLNNKVVVGSGFSFDITDFFHFKRRKQETGYETIFDEMEGKSIAWIILFYSVCNAALIPSYNARVSACVYLKSCWRFFVQSFLILPFVFYQYRVASAEQRKKYEIRYILNLQNLRHVFLSAFGTCFWLCIIFRGFQWTYTSHVLVLGSLANFFLSLNRSSRGTSHQLESGGQALIVLSIILILCDTFMLFYEDTENYSEYSRTYFMERSVYSNIAYDILALFVSFCMAKLSAHTSNLKKVFPPYLSMALVNITICITMSFTSYFFLGATFNSDPIYGVFNIFSQEHFSTFLYLSVILCLGMIISFVMLTRLFPDPIIPALGMTFDSFFAACFLELSGVQQLPGSFAILGYTIMVPGRMLILIGNWISQKKLVKEQRQEQVRLTRMSHKSQQYCSRLSKRSRGESIHSPGKKKKSRIFSAKTSRPSQRRNRLKMADEIFSSPNRSVQKQSSHESQ